MCLLCLYRFLLDAFTISACCFCGIVSYNAYNDTRHTYDVSLYKKKY